MCTVDPLHLLRQCGFIGWGNHCLSFLLLQNCACCSFSGPARLDRGGTVCGSACKTKVVVKWDITVLIKSIKPSVIHIIWFVWGFCPIISLNFLISTIMENERCREVHLVLLPPNSRFCWANCSLLCCLHLLGTVFPGGCERAQERGCKPVQEEPEV